MADGTVLLEVIIEGKNARVVQRQVEQVTDSVNKNSAAQRQNTKATNEAANTHAHYDRALKGVHQTNLSGAKSFSKIRDAVGGGSSGLVGAYATLAANLFAATAAFSALQKAAQVEQLTQGLSALGTASGLAMGSLSKGLQEATGYAVSLQDSMRSVAMVTSAGFDPSIIERLGKVAKNTSVALGRDLQDSLNRVVKGATKLEPELLDELGIMVRIDEATQQYAKQMGKSASQLTNFEKRQAFMNAVLAEGEKKFGAIGASVDANPYDKLSASLQELSTTVLNAFNVILGPVVEFFAESKLALGGFIAMLSKGIIGQALPILSMLAAKSAQVAAQLAGVAIASDTAGKKEAEKLKAQIKPLPKSLGPVATEFNQNIQAAKSVADYEKANERLTASIDRRKANIEKAKKLQEAATMADGEARKEIEAKNKTNLKDIATAEKNIALLEAQREATQRLIDVEKQRRAGTFAGGPGIPTAVAKAEGRFAGRSAAVLSSLDINPSVENYKKQMTKALAAGARYRASMAENAAASAGFAGKIPLIGNALGRGAVAFKSFGLAAKVAVKGIFTAIPVIGQVLFFIDLLIQAVGYLFNLFKSDATKANEEQITKLSESYKELSKNSEEVNRAFVGVSSSIVTQTQAVTAQFNIISSANAEFKKTFETAANAGDFSDLIDQTEQLIDKNNALKKALEEKIKVELNGKDISSLSDQARANFLKEFLVEQDKAITSQRAYNEAIKDTGDQLTKYFNTLTTASPLEAVIGSFDNLRKAQENLAKDSEKAGNKFERTKALLDNLGGNALALLGLTQLSEDFQTASKQADSFNSIVSGFPELQKKVAFWDLFGNVNEEVVAQANERIKEMNVELTRLGKQTIKPIEFTFTMGSGALKQELAKVASYLMNIKGLSKDIGSAEKLREEAEKKINERIKEAQKNYAEIYKQTLLISLAQVELNDLTAEQSKYILLNNSQIAEKIDAQKKINDLQIVANNLQIQELAIAANFEKDNSNKLKLLQAINNLQSQNAKLTADNVVAERDKEINIAKNTLKNIEEQVRLHKEIVTLIEKEAQLTSSITDAKENIRLLDLQIADLRAGGTGEVDVSSQLRVLKEFENEKQANIDREYSIKLRMIGLEEKVTRARLAVAIAELQAIIKQEESKKSPPKPVAAQATTSQPTQPAQDIYSSTARTALRSLMESIGMELTDAATTAASTVTTAVESSTPPQVEMVFNEQELQGLKDVLAEMQKGDVAGAIAVLERDAALLERKKKEREATKTTLETERANAERTYTLAIDGSNAILSAAQSIDDIYSKINSAKTSILDNERTVRENELKAINLRERGRYELTAQQTLDLEIEYANKKSALIKEEEARKLNMIDLEYALLEAQMRFQKFQMRANLEAYARAAQTRAADAAFAKTKPENKDPKIQAQLNTIITEANNVAKNINETVIKDLENRFEDVIRKIPELAKLMKDQVRSETASAISDLDASKLIKDRNIVLTATIETIMPGAGQLFDSKAYRESIGMARQAAMQDQLGTVNSQMKDIEQQKAKLLDSDVIDLNKYVELGNKLKELNAQKTAISTGQDPFTNIKMGIAGASVALAPFIESLKTLGPQGELVASIASGTLVMADSITKFSESSKTAADKFALVGAVVSSVASIIGAASQAKIAGIDAEINAEKQRDGKSKESLARIASMEKKKEAAKRKAFETNKKMMMATTIINTAAAAMAAWAPPPTGAGPLFGGALTAMIVALGAAQLAIISGMQYEGGGGSVSSAAPTSISVGQRRSSIDLAKSQSASGELGYLQGDKGMGGPENFRPAFIGSRAAGGRVNAGYMVGEQGPELFVPKLPGKIVPADKVNNAPAQNVNISITALDASGVEEVLVKQRGHIIGMIREAANSYGEKFLETVDTSVYTQPSRGYGVARA